MDNTISLKESVVNSDPAKASNDPNVNLKSNSQSSSKRRSKTRSKVWEKVAWFTRKSKSGRENRSESSEEDRKEEQSHTVNVLRAEERDECRVDILNAIGNNSPSPRLCKTKSKSGIRKTKSFNYLKRKKLKHYAIEANSTLREGAIKENADCSSTCQTATGNFHDFASIGRRSSSILTCSNSLVTEMAKELNLKQEEQLKDSISLLSLNDRTANNCQNCQGFLCRCKPNTSASKSISCAKYHSWPRKKRLLVTNQSHEAFSPPQKQKKVYGLRKTATFSGFDSSKLCSKEPKEKSLRGVKSTPLLLPGHNQIKNQNGLAIGVIHFFKSSKNENSNYDSAVSLKKCVMKAELPNVNNFELSDDFTRKQTSDANTDNVGLLEDVHHHSGLESKMSGNFEQLPSSQSNLESNEFFAENGQYGQNINNKENISKDLAEGDNIGAFVSMKDCLVIDPASGISRVAFDNSCTSHHIATWKQDIEQTSESLCASVNDESTTITIHSEASLQDLTFLHSPQPSCTTDKRPTKDKFELIQGIQDSLAQVNTDNIIELEKKIDKHNIDNRESMSTQICPQDKLTETGIFCIKIEDQVTDFSKEGKLDFLTQSKQHPPSITQEMFVEEFQDNSEIKENQQSQTVNNSKASGVLCAITNNSIIEDKHEKVIPKRIMSTNFVLPSNTGSITLEEETIISYKGEILQKDKIQNSQTMHFNTLDENQSTLHLLKRSKPKVDGQDFKHQTETILNWFSVFNDEQKNILIKKLLEQCELPQMHLLSVVMKPLLHKSCPPNCQDMLAWLPNPVTTAVMSYLDPESLCSCSKVNKYWNSLASNPLNWKRLCKSSEWKLSRKTEEKQLMIYAQSCGTVQWKKMFAERYLLRKNWLNGKCKVRTFEGHTQGISCVQFDDTRIVSGSTDKTIKVWDLSRDDSHAVLTLAGHSGTVRCLNLNGNRLVSGSVDKSIKVWDLSFESYWSGASCKVTMVGHMHTVRCLQVNDNKVVSGSYDKTLKVWDLKTGQCKLTLRGHNAAVLCVQFDDNKIVSGSYDNTIKVWGLDEGECLMTLAGHHDAVTCLNLTQDCRKVISGSLDHNLKFWDLATGKCIGTLDWIRSEGHTGVIRCLQSDSWRIVSAGDDKTLKMWSLETGQRLLTLRCHTDGVTCLQFNDYRIVSGSYDKTVKVWNFSPEHEFLNPS